MDTFVQNYNYIVSPLNETKDSIVITTTTKEGIYYMDTANSGVFVSPEMQPTPLIMPSPEILRTNNVINSRASWIFSVKTNKNSLPKGSYLTIKIPKNVLLTIPNSKIDILNQDTSSIYSNTTIYYYQNTTV